MRDNAQVGSVENIVIAKRTGVCYGVREAIDKAKIASASGKDTHTLGHVVHNEGLIADLRARGIKNVDHLDEDASGTLVEEGYDIVLLGTPNHPEVVGLLGFAPNAMLVDEEEDWASIPRRKRMALITQSTQPPWKFERLAAFLVSRCHELKVINTVCPVTIRRQEDTIAIAREVQLMIVVGGTRSANTKELTRLCEISGTHAVQIESAQGLTDPDLFANIHTVGITGGTSTPIEDLERVALRIAELGGTDHVRTNAASIARAALEAAATPQYRTTSITNNAPA